MPILAGQSSTPRHVSQAVPRSKCYVRPINPALAEIEARLDPLLASIILNMSGLTRYMFRQALLVMLSVCLVFSFAVWLVQALRLIDLIVNRGLSIGVFLHLAVLILPRFVDVVLPVAVFFAVLFVYNKLIAESELVVMRAAGVGPLALARPAFLTGITGMVLLYALALYFLPAATRSFKDLQFEIRNRFASVLIQDGVFNTVSDRLMIYVKSRDDNGELLSILIYDNRQPGKPI